MAEGCRGARTETEVSQYPIEQGALRVRRECRHDGDRRSGSDMHRGPPPPRASSLPSIVITVRCLASVQSSNARKFTAGTTLNPADVSSHRVASFLR